jgi:hypothetical protein
MNIQVSDGEAIIDPRFAESYPAYRRRKQMVYRAYHAAIMDGTLVRGPCEVCGATKNQDGSGIEGHHDDYSRPLKVRWLCEEHHIQWHRENGKDSYVGERKERKPILSLPEVIPTGLIEGRQIRAARGLTGISQLDLAKTANVALATLRRMEGTDGPVNARTETLFRVQTTLEKAGVEFLNDERPGVRLRLRR